MSLLNWVFTLSSINVLLMIIERFSFTTNILLPYGFLRLHELLQIITLILFTVLLPAWTLIILSHDFRNLQSKNGLILFFIFITGIYFYATGNGLHEVSSFNYNTNCSARLMTQLCQTFFINDYYTGNILYFLGGILIIVPLLFLEKLYSRDFFSRKELNIMAINAVVYAFTIFAYAAFDPAVVGITYSIIIMLIADVMFFKIIHKFRKYPFISYTALTYTLGTLAAILVRLH